jgi:hypothetical protein
MTDEQMENFALLNELSQKAASGTATEEEMNALDALQDKMGIKYVNTKQLRALNKLEKLVDDGHKLVKKIEKFIK